MPQPDWDHKHPGDYPAYTDSQHGPNLHTHGADGKVDTIMGKSINPPNPRCGLEACDYSDALDRLQERFNAVWTQQQYLGAALDELLTSLQPNPHAMDLVKVKDAWPAIGGRTTWGVLRRARAAIYLAKETR